MKLSIIIPAYNEQNTIETVINKLYSVNFNTETEIVIINDGANDGTDKKVDELKQKFNNLKYVVHIKNLGKGSAIKTAKSVITGDIIVIQDADLEYNPGNLIQMIDVVNNKSAKVVYGSRFLKHNPTLYLHYLLGNKFMTFMFNLFFGTNLTDVYSGYKMVAKEIWDKIDIESKGFEFEIEITAKIAKLKIPIIEMPIDYFPRSIEQGKKIKLRDIFIGIKTLIIQRIRD